MERVSELSSGPWVGAGAEGEAVSVEDGEAVWFGVVAKNMLILFPVFCTVTAEESVQKAQSHCPCSLLSSQTL